MPSHPLREEDDKEDTALKKIIDGGYEKWRAEKNEAGREAVENSIVSGISKIQEKTRMRRKLLRQLVENARARAKIEEEQREEYKKVMYNLAEVWRGMIEVFAKPMIHIPALTDKTRIRKTRLSDLPKLEKDHIELTLSATVGFETPHPVEFYVRVLACDVIQLLGIVYDELHKPTTFYEEEIRLNDE